jgi:hypothetical protein
MEKRSSETVMTFVLVAALCVGAFLCGMLFASREQPHSVSQWAEQEQMERRQAEDGGEDSDSSIWRQGWSTLVVPPSTYEGSQKFVKGDISSLDGGKPLEEGDTRRIPLENIEGIEKLSGLPSESVELSWLYVGHYLSYWDYDLDEVRIRIFDKIQADPTNRFEDSGAPIYEYVYFFQIIGEHTYCYVHLPDTRIHSPYIYVSELAKHIEGVNDYFY